MLPVAVESFFIVLREGLEALLVIAALAAFLQRAGEGHRRIALLWGSLAALAASLVAAWVFYEFFGGAHDDLTEAIVMSVAAMLLLYVSGWLWLRQDPAVWKQRLQAQTEQALRVDGPWLLAGIAFLAVFREGAETILFLHAAMANAEAGAQSGVQGMLLGLIGAALALALIYLAMTKLALRLPLRPVFAVTSAILFLLGLRFIGGALLEFQEIGWLPYDDAGLPAWAVQAGFNPTLQALGLQAALLGGALLFMGMQSRAKRRAMA
ncbi:FTR1 family protein [Ferrovibrio sp.]|uniref:FTR1 family protein n=1 Tax=Ferrovibrio sp. TaxID=1917215 RepID=UPI00262EEDCF|nr:FTR1 family protein [Ferrovibrio sp.]